MRRCIFYRQLATLLLLSCLSFGAAGANIIIPDNWQIGNTEFSGLSGEQLNYSGTLTGNVCVPPYYYLVSDDGREHIVETVTSICGSSHDGTWVQAPRLRMAAQSSWYGDGPFLGAVMDTLRLPATLNKIGDGGFENGTANVLICGAVTPPSFENPNQYIYPIYAAKLIVPTGSLEAYSTHDAWGKFALIEEGAENYMPAQMVNVESGWYEVRSGQAKLIKCYGGTSVIADNIELQNHNYPVREMGIASIDPYSVKSLTLNSHITDFNPDYHLASSDSFYRGFYQKYKIALGYIYVSPDNPAYSSIDGVLYTKDYKQLLYFSRAYSYSRRAHVVPICCESIAEGAVAKSAGNAYRGYATLLLPRPLANYCSGEVECSIVVAANDFPVIQGDSISALYSDANKSFDLHRYTTEETDIIIPAALTEYGVSYPVKTIGKYGLYLGGHIYDSEINDMFWKYFSTGTVRDTDDRVIFPPLTKAQTAIIPENVEEIYYVFCGASNLKSVQLPQTLRLIGYKAFQDCKSLEEINLPSQLDSIGPYAFWGCHSLTSIRLPRSLKVISSGCFNTCKNMTSIELPSQLEVIASMAFKNCVKLEELVIPATTKFIAPSAFENCYALHDIYCLGLTPPLIMSPGQDPDLIYDVPFTKLFGETMPTPSSCTLHVPAGSLQAYRSAWVWKEFENIVEDADPSAVQVLQQEQRKPTTHYNLSGIQTNVQRGLNIVRYSDGTVKKVIIK